MPFVLVTTRGRKLGLAIPIRSRTFVIGSSPRSDVRSRRPGIGHRHCALLVRKKQLFVQDLQSGQATQVNGLTLTPGARQPLKVGDRLTLGPIEFVIDHRAPRPKGAVRTGIPYSSPPLPVGLPAQPVRAVPVIAGAVPGAGAQPVSTAWSLVALGLLACVGLGSGVLLSRFLIGNSPDDRTARRGRSDTDSSAKDRDTLLAQKGPPIVLPPDPLRRPPELPKPPEKKPEEGKKPDEGKKPPEKKPEPPRPPEKKPDEPKPPEKKPGGEPKPPEKKPEPKPPEKKPEPKPPEKKPEPEPKPPEKKPEPPEKKPETKPPSGGTRLTFNDHLLPLFKARCADCHNAKKTRGGLDMSSVEGILKGGDGGAAVVPGDPEKSPLFQRVDDGSMPPAGKPLSKEEKKLIQDWIQGAKDGKLASR